jgi:hypothetical protein
VGSVLTSDVGELVAVAVSLAVFVMVPELEAVGKLEAEGINVCD